MWVINNDELMHYGVAGMRWGVIRSTLKEKTNPHLEKKSYKYDKKSASYGKRSEKVHASHDLGSSNRKMVKAKKYEKKSAKKSLKATKAKNDIARSVYEKMAAKYKLKAAKNEMAGNLKSKSRGYGIQAMRLSKKSDKYKYKSMKKRYKIASNNKYIKTFDKKISKISKEDLSGAYKFVDDYMKRRGKSNSNNMVKITKRPTVLVDYSPEVINKNYKPIKNKVIM